MSVPSHPSLIGHFMRIHNFWQIQASLRQDIWQIYSTGPCLNFFLIICKHLSHNWHTIIVTERYDKDFKFQIFTRKMSQMFLYTKEGEDLLEVVKGCPCCKEGFPVLKVGFVIFHQIHYLCYLQKEVIHFQKLFSFIRWCIVMVGLRRGMLQTLIKVCWWKILKSFGLWLNDNCLSLCVC